MRYDFNKLFYVDVEGRLCPKHTVKLAGNIFTNSACISKGTIIHGEDLFEYVGEALEVEKRDNVYEIFGFYK